MTIDRSVWLGGLYSLMSMVSSLSCSACYLDRPDPGALGEYPKERSERAADSSEPTSDRDAGPDDASAAEPPRAAEPATSPAPAAERLSVTLEVSAKSVCPGECLTVSADAEGGHGELELRWGGDEGWSGPGPHRACPEKKTRYRVDATDTSRPKPMTTASEVSVEVRSDCDASEPPPQTAPAPGMAEPASRWTMMGYDLASTYFNSAERKLTKESAARLQERFTVELGGEVLGAPLLVDGVLYAAAGNTIVALRVDDGSRIWETRTEEVAGAASLNSLAFDGGQLYAQLQNSSVLALDASTGMLMWMLPPDRQTEFERGYSSPIVVNDLVLVGRSSDAAAFADEAAADFRGSLLALDKRSGSLVWRTFTVSEDESGAGFWSTPSVDLMSGMVFATAGNNIRAPVTASAGALLAFELETGVLRFSHQSEVGSSVPINSATMPELGANPVLYDVETGGQTRKLVAASSKSGTVSALDRETTELVWLAELGPGTDDRDRGVLSNTTWSGRNVLVATNNGTGGPEAAQLYALDGATGKLVWLRALSERVFGKVTVANGVGFIGVGSALEIFDADTGAFIKSIPTGGTTAGGIASIADGLVAFGTGASWLSDKTEAGRVIVLEAKP